MGRYIKIALFVAMSFLSIGQVKADEPRLLPIYSVYTQEKKVALTFDCAWGASDIPEILTILKENEVPATFFMVGDWIRKYPEEVKSIAAEGHELGNHSDKHPHVTKLDKEEIKKDIRFAHNTLKELTGVDARLYRPPYGEYNNTVIEAANECQYYTIQWDVDSLDWKEYGKEQLIDKVLKHKNLGSGSIILMHNDTKYTKHALDTIVKGLKQKGYTFVTVSDLILKEGYTIDHTGRQYPAS
ncbi:MAG: polysaccharide deacetylase family sporulation protein PdaB [Cellulosilyticaceae bacterium]